MQKIFSWLKEIIKWILCEDFQNILMFYCKNFNCFEHYEHVSVQKFQNLELNYVTLIKRN